MSPFDLIASRIRERGPITVAEFMSLALYHPEVGYYARRERRTGRQGDFVTSVDIGPLFGKLLARQFAEMWRVLESPKPKAQSPKTKDQRPDVFDLVEAGAANGQLARDILDSARIEHPDFYAAVRLHLVEASPAARAVQRSMLVEHGDKLASSASRLPDAIHGVIYANELVDALPVHAVIMTAEGLRECYVDERDGRLVERVGPLSTPALERHLGDYGAAMEPGWRAEVNLAALAWMTRACLSLHQGFMVLVDYGHEADELYSVTHSAGTLASFTKHVGEERRGEVTPWLVEPGERDITSHVNLSAMRDVAESLGCHTLGMLDQTYFLLALVRASETLSPRDRLALKTLIMPGGLGSTHKVMIFGKNVGTPRLAGLAGPSRLT